ncbi:uncharacterized protein LOC122009531 [Zingiber officinale]|uniref:uncharacterized protein LOC122009531 n=1 Tax=Zingiber officinale TaxID=94328 RepID=UPI001C4DD6D4|nr:uncharacterized protein LOC122009531 [Zingiber officinale]
MATQVVMGLSKIALLLGAGSILMRNGRLSDILSELQDMVKGLEKSAEEGSVDSEHTEALASQVRRLAMEMRQIASARPITILNGNSGVAGNMTSLVIPTVALGALGYGFMWWKGISFYDFMYVTKRNMETAVASMAKHLDQVSAALAQAKKHLTQRIENLDGKMDEQKGISGEIKNEVVEVRGKVDNIGFELNNLQQLLWGLNGRVSSIEDKQNFACAGVMYLCQFVEGKGGKMPDLLMDGLDSGRKRRFLGASEAKQLKGLQDIVEAFETENYDTSNIDEIIQNDTNLLNNLKSKSLSRTISLKI